VHLSGLKSCAFTSANGSCSGVFLSLRGLTRPNLYLLAPADINAMVPITMQGTSDAEQKRLAEAYEDCEQHYRALVAQVRDYAIFALDPAGNALTWNEGVEAVLGYSEEEFIGSPVELLFVPDDIEAGVPQRELDTARRDGVASDDRWLRRKDGTRFYAVGRTTRRTDAKGHFVGFSKVFRDETQRVLTEAALRDSEDRFRTLVQNLTDYAIFMLDAKGRITYWTEGARRVSGYRAEEVMGRHLAMFYTQDAQHAAEAERELAIAAATGRVEREGWRVKKSGERVWVNEIATALYGPDGRLTGFTKISRDLTERKKSEDALREADQRKDEFLATLAHELRNPLAPLRNGLHILRLTSSPDSPSRPTVEMMDRQLTHLVRLVDDLLDVARIRTGKIGLQKKPLYLREVLTASIEAARAAIDANKHRLRVEIPDEDLQVEGDFDRLAQVLQNLLSNAAKYMDPGGEIAVRLERENATAVLRVLDNGVGIPEADLPRVFELFSQVRSHEGRAAGGLGIGLSLVRTLVELHGGTIQAHSDGPGSGSEFVVRLPLWQRDARVASSTSGEALSPENEPHRRVLIVDDNVDAAATLATLFTMRGHQVEIAHDGLEAIETVKRFSPELVMMDLGMPRMDGLEATRHLRALPGGDAMQIIALTGWGQESDRARTRAAGFDAHLVKPLDQAVLWDLLKQARAARMDAR
jgi:PAS domain S-box-containing protein